jgi:peptidyl-prolyl cis-trans isomerase A (cyclophilin A)
MVVFETSLGDFKLEFFPEDAPITVENFLGYVDEGFFDGTVFHRVIPEFMVQAGGFDEEMHQKSTRDQIKNEADNGLKNERGSLSMARTAEVDSATSQFFINLKDNEFLDHNPRDFGYAVFARVAEGMDVVDEIAKVPTGSNGGHQDVPIEPVLVKSARRVEV